MYLGEVREVRRVIGSRCARTALKAQAVLLAGTDLSSFYSEQPPLYRFLDVARLHIDEIMRRARAA